MSILTLTADILALIRRESATLPPYQAPQSARDSTPAAWWGCALDPAGGRVFWEVAPAGEIAMERLDPPAERVVATCPADARDWPRVVIPITYTSGPSAARNHAERLLWRGGD